MSEKKKLTAYVVSHTHWDREWRYSIWKTRLLLVEMMDELIDNLESGRYKSFLMDGQIAPVLDYLEICPDKKDQVKKLISSGQIEIGPWYTLPDEYPVDGESLVRNLLWGDRFGKEFGGVLKVGYTPFGWGQTAQLPQIYQGFGIDVAMIGKRVNKQRAPKSEFLWRAPDGSEMLTTRFGEGGRNNFYFKIHLSSLFGIDHEGPDWYYNWSKGGTAFHRIDKENTEQDFCMLNAPDRWYPETITPELLQETWDTTNESVIENDRLMMNGTDYAASQAIFPEMLERINELDRDHNRQWIQTSIHEFAELMKEKVSVSNLPVVAGELRDGPASGVTGNALTTRLYVKSLNKKAENNLIKFSEPLDAIASMLGVQSPQKMLQMAWQYLLQSQPHDSINGVTQDKTVLDVENRLLQVIDLADTIGEQALKELVKKIDLSDFSDDDVLVVVFNPSPYARKEVVEAYIDMPDEQSRLPGWTIDEREWVQIYDSAGTVVGSQCMGYTKENCAVTEIHTRAFPYLTLRFHVYFDAGKIPAGGYKVFKAVMKTDEVGEGECWSNPLARTGTLLKSPDVMENEYLRVTMNGDGTFNLFDKELNREFRGLNYYEDRGELGDYWINKRPMFDQKFSSRGGKAKKWCCEEGPLQTTLVSEVQMDIPGQGINQQQRRGDDIIPLMIRTFVTLKAGQHHVEVNVEFENRHENHYLRAMFPTGIADAEYADAGGHFIVDRRPIRPQGPTDNSVWPDMGTLPYANFVDISDDQIGMAFMDNCLTEYEVLEDDQRTVALSLLRCVKNWICTEYRVGSNFPSQKGGQCLGRHSVRYAIMPHKGNWQDGNVPLSAEIFNVPVCPVQTRKHEGTLSSEAASLFAIDNDSLCFSALKRCEDRETFIIRIYNPTSEQQKGSIRFVAELSQAWQTNLNEDRIGEIKLTNKHAVSIEVGPQKIVTVEVAPW